MKLTSKVPGQTPVIDQSEKSDNTEAGHNTSTNTPNLDSDTTSSDVQSHVLELEAVVKEQQQKVEALQRKMTSQEDEIAKISELGVSSLRIERLEEQVEWTANEIHHMMPRIEALTQVSDLYEQGNCPKCGSKLDEEQSFTDLGAPSAIKCSGCGRVAGHRV
ncbi:hypothetical protein [Halogranum rubrum]|uniref:hypothetical protein n=1 Tax=Halogranum rubrum TaxID=553466 RepID=UPI001ED961E4|nr:hypothetical protein [Halogranum salarium]